MTIFRFSAPAIILSLSLALLGCSEEKSKTTPVPDLLAGDLGGEDLADAFWDRIEFLAKDRDLMEREMLAAGFVMKKQGEDCGSWEHLAPEEDVKAYVRFCASGDGVETFRQQILRKSERK